MTEQELHKANSVANTLKKLKKNLEGIEIIQEDHSNGKDLAFMVRTGDDFRDWKNVELHYQFLPIIPEDFLHDYKMYLQKEIDTWQKVFNEL